MGSIREFRREDVADVAALWLRVFRRRAGPAPQHLQDYFRHVFFDNPWRDPALPSLVYQDPGKRVAGFLGVIPRAMSFHGAPIRVAVCTQLMVDESARPSYAAAKLVKALFAGAQDLSFSDGANGVSEKLWQSAGGSVALLYSLRWTQVLRPAEYALLQLQRREPLQRLARALLPGARAIDAAVARGALGPRLRKYRPRQPPGTVVEHAPSDETLLGCVRQFCGGRALLPKYSLESFGWLVGRAGDKKRHGDLRKGVVRGLGGKILGWYLYYLQRGEVAQVLQFGGRPGSIHGVLNTLAGDAWRQGAVALAGQVEPRFAVELADRGCHVTWPGYTPGIWAVAHSKNAALLDAIQRGDAFLTRLEGEWWARFSDPLWSVAAPRSSEHRPGVGQYFPRTDRI